MSNFSENKFAQVTVLSLFVFAFALNAGTPMPSVTPAMINTVSISHGPTMPPAPWDGLAVVTGPTMPPDPWAGLAVVTGPTMPPDPWAGLA